MVSWLSSVGFCNFFTTAAAAAAATCAVGILFTAATATAAAAATAAATTTAAAAAAAAAAAVALALIFGVLQRFVAKCIVVTIHKISGFLWVLRGRDVFWSLDRFNRDVYHTDDHALLVVIELRTKEHLVGGD